jgi:7,8-dihydroneopterin aldolase/epimerase/oxygenase
LSSERGVAVPLPVPDVLEADEHHYRILVRDLVLECSIGAYPEERIKTQRVRFNLDLRVRRPVPPLNDELENVLSYDKIIAEIRSIVATGHINLVETLAEQICDICLADRRVARASVMVEKLDIEPAAAGVGVEIERSRPRNPSVAEVFPLVFDGNGKVRGNR